MNGQLELPLRDPLGASGRLPFAVSPRQIRCFVRRRLRAAGVPDIALRVAAEDLALLEQLRCKVRRRARGDSRKSKLRTTAYLATTEGRRAVRAMDQVSARIAAQEARLCG
jgi:hypothetical protein